MGDEEKDTITTHAPQNLLDAIFDEQRIDSANTVSESKTKEVNTEDELHAVEKQGMEQQVGEEANALPQDDHAEGSLRDSLESPNRQSFEKVAKEDDDEQQGTNEPDNVVFSRTSDKSTEGKAIGVKSSPKRVSSKRSSGAGFINKNKENLKQPTSRTYAAMHKAKVKKQWNETRNRKPSKEREERQWTQNPEGLGDSFGSAGINLGTSNAYELYDSTNSNLLNNHRRIDWNESELQSIEHQSSSVYHPYQMRYSELNTSGTYSDGVQQPQPYQQQQNQMGYYGRNYNSAVHYPCQTNLPTLQHTFASQSAPPGMYSHLHRPLADQVDCLPEEENCLSSTLPNSQFLDAQNLQGSRTPNSRLRRKFTSEPCLPNAASTCLKEEGRTEGYGANSRHTVSYKPYTLRDYRRVREVESTSFGGLGPNIETSEYKERIRKVSKQKEYAEMLRTQHAGLKKHWQKYPQLTAHETAQIKQGEAKRQAALNYARSVPKPKKVNKRDKSASEQQRETRQVCDLTLTEILRMRHEKEKNEVDAIRKELASKIRL